MEWNSEGWNGVEYIKWSGVAISRMDLWNRIMRFGEYNVDVPKRVYDWSIY